MIKKITLGITLFFSTLMFSTSAFADEFKTYENGWRAYVKVIDPFDSTKVKIESIYKGDFIFDCRNINMRIGGGYYSSFSLPSKIKYIVDERPVVDKRGTYSSFHSGNDLMTDSSYYSFKLDFIDVMSFEDGRTLKLAGKWGEFGWENSTLNLTGFKSMFDKMCS
ncbi:hypothetical protein OAP52_04145 [Hellea sp.]|nr:hypothetical protein [Hellea sp.]